MKTCFEEFCEKNIPYYYKFSVFLLWHWFRMFLVWCHKTCIQPIERTLKQFNKEEPSEKQWVQLYTMTCISDVDEIGFLENEFVSYEKYFYPYTTNFNNFVENEFHFFLENAIHLEDKSTAEIIENLFIVKNGDHCLVKSFPIYKKIESIDWVNAPAPKTSEIFFSFVEYHHPKMMKSLEMVIPSDYYMVGNDLFTSAFVLRQLELMNCSFAFDNNYEIHILDHEFNEKHLTFEEHIEVQENSYIIRKNLQEEEVAEDDDLVKIEQVSDKNDDNNSILSETTYWWKLF